MIWTDEYLSQLIEDGERDIAARVSAIFTRFSINVSAGVRGITLPVSTMGIIQVTWQGKRVYPLYQSEMIELSATYRTEQGEPKFYLISNEGLLNLKFFPVPNVSIAADDSAIYGSGIRDRVIVTAYRWPETQQATYHVPDYIARRTVKAFVLWRAFQREGKGQNLKAAQYYKNKYEILIREYRQVKESLTDAKVILDDRYRLGRKPPAPRLAPNFVITP